MFPNNMGGETLQGQDEIDLVLKAMAAQDMDLLSNGLRKEVRTARDLYGEMDHSSIITELHEKVRILQEQYADKPEFTPIIELLATLIGYLEDRSALDGHCIDEKILVLNPLAAEICMDKLKWEVKKPKSKLDNQARKLGERLVEQYQSDKEQLKKE